MNFATLAIVALSTVEAVTWGDWKQQWGHHSDAERPSHGHGHGHGRWGWNQDNADDDAIEAIVEDIIVLEAAVEDEEPRWGAWGQNRGEDWRLGDWRN